MKIIYCTLLFILVSCSKTKKNTNTTNFSIPENSSNLKCGLTKDSLKTLTITQVETKVKTTELKDSIKPKKEITEVKTCSCKEAKKINSPRTQVRFNYSKYHKKENDSIFALWSLKALNPYLLEIMILYLINLKFSLMLSM